MSQESENGLPAGSEPESPIETDGSPDASACEAAEVMGFPYPSDRIEVDPIMSRLDTIKTSGVPAVIVKPTGDLKDPAYRKELAEKIFEALLGRKPDYDDPRTQREKASDNE